MDNEMISVLVVEPSTLTKNPSQSFATRKQN